MQKLRFPLTIILFILAASTISFAQNEPKLITLNPIRLTNIEDTYPAFSPDMTKIAFQSTRTGNPEIFVVNADGKTGLKQLTNNDAYDGDPKWSPDGKKILFGSNRDNNQGFEVYVMNADGSNQQRLTNQPGDDGHPNWSADGTRIIFNSARTTPDLKADFSQQIHELFSMKSDGSDVKQITSFKTISTYPSFSPDGTKIAFRMVTPSPGLRWDFTNAQRNSEIFVINIDGTNPVNVSNSAAYDGWSAWSPDSKKILFSSNRSGPANIGQIYIVNSDGTGLQKITDGSGSFVQGIWSLDGKEILASQSWETGDFANLVVFEIGQQSNEEDLSIRPKRITNIEDTYPVFSPDMKKLAFQSNRTGNTEIYISEPDGKTGLKQLTFNNAYDGNPKWSPDGKKIVFASERDNGDSEIYVMNADGSEQTRLTNQPGDDAHPNWSPDGTRIIFNSGRTTPDPKADWSQQIHELFSMKADGSEVKQVTSFKTISTYPAYSPDGTKIAFRMVTITPGFRWDFTNAQRNSEVFVINIDGTNPVNVSNSAAYDGWGAWSPDSKKILFSSNRSGPANIGQLFVVSADGTGLRQITNGPGSFVQATWSSDGKKIVANQHWESGDFGNLVVFEVPSNL